MLEIHKKTEGAVIVLSLVGQLDANTSTTLTAEIDSILDSNQYKIVLDFAEVSLVDSSGIGALVAAYKKAKISGGETKICGLDKQPLEVFRILALDHIFDLASTADQSIQHFEA